MLKANRGKILIFKGVQKVSESAIKKWEDISKTAIKNTGYFTAAISGGRDPLDFYKKMAQSDRFPWDKTHLFLVDERFVPALHSDSNYGMIKNILLNGVNIPYENVHPVDTGLPNVKVAAEKYEEDIRNFFKLNDNEFPAFDLIMLGIGEDGHTASLFPGGPELAETKRLAMAVKSNNARHERVTISLPVINNSKNVIFLITEPHKARILKDVLEGKGERPASLIKPRSGKLFFLIEEKAAASLL